MLSSALHKHLARILNYTLIVNFLVPSEDYTVRVNKSTNPLGWNLQSFIVM